MVSDFFGGNEESCRSSSDDSAVVPASGFLAWRRRADGRDGGGWHGAFMLAVMGDRTSPGRRAFLCYAREDGHVVGLLRAALETEGVLVWRDTEELRSGE